MTIKGNNSTFMSSPWVKTPMATPPQATRNKEIAEDLRIKYTIRYKV